MKIRFILLAIIFVVIHQLNAQDSLRYNKEVLLGLQLPVGDEISSIYDQGFSAEFRLVKPVKNHIVIKPFVSYSFYGNKPLPNERESMHFFALGLKPNLRFKLSPSLNMLIGPSLNMNYYFSHSKQDGVLARDWLFSYDAVGIIEYQRFFLELNYHFINSKPKTTDALDSKLYSYDGLYQMNNWSDEKIDLSSISINVGFKF